MAPLDSLATHSVAVGHSTALGAAWSTRKLVHFPPAGSVDVAIVPLSPTATQSEIDGQSTSAKNTSCAIGAYDQAIGPPLGLR